MEVVNNFKDHGPAYLAKQLANVRRSVDELEHAAKKAGREGEAAVEIRKAHQQLERVIIDIKAG
tara:strand:+ start:234 stop:425 length:192 start_codon:yes stop_codon:yes gene_type:complete